jgi:hypothetical protein
MEGEDVSRLTKYRSRRKNDNAPISRTLLIKTLICLALVLAAWLARRFGPAEFYDVLLYKIESGPRMDEIIEAFGKAPVSSEAFTYLWNEGVVDVILPTQ